MARYGAIIDGKKGAYGVVIPDLPGCVAMGRTVDDALRNASDAAIEWAEVAKSKGLSIPKPRTLESLRDNADVAKEIKLGGALVVVALILNSGRPVKANLSLDAGLLDALDEAAAASNLTRSAFVASAVREKIIENAA